MPYFLLLLGYIQMLLYCLFWNLILICDMSKGEGLKWVLICIGLDLVLPSAFTEPFYSVGNHRYLAKVKAQYSVIHRGTES